MKRRNFVKTASASLSLPIILGGSPISAFGRTNAVDALLEQAEYEDRVLVLVRLNGGNDGLNTLVPLDQYSNLFAVRESIILPENSLQNTRIGDTNAFHPIMTGLKELFDTEKLGIIQSVGYPNPNKSHFRSTDIWTAASAADVVETSGWMGRYLDKLNPGFPEGYPNVENPDPLAITIGNQLSQTCQGPSVNMGMALANLEGGQDLWEDGGSTPESKYGHELSFLRQSFIQTNKYRDSILTAAQLAPENLSELYPTDYNSLAEELKLVARLIAGGLKTKVYVVDLGGFDTHAAQVTEGQATETAGRHFELLKQVSEAIFAFQDDLRLFGLEDRVLGMTFSEFGRRIKSNDSFGTDHGAAAPLFVFGSQVNNQILGTNPIIPVDAGVQDNIPMQYDFRAIYSSVLIEWFGAPEQMVQEVMLGDTYEMIPLLKQGTVSIENELAKDIRMGQNYPNPFVDMTRIPLELDRTEHIQIKIYNAMGQEQDTLLDRKLAVGKHEIPFEGHQLPAGNYYARMQVGPHQQVKLMQKR